MLIFMQRIVPHCKDSKSSIDLIYIILYDVNVDQKIGSTLSVSNLVDFPVFSPGILFGEYPQILEKFGS